MEVFFGIFSNILFVEIKIFKSKYYLAKTQRKAAFQLWRCLKLKAQVEHLGIHTF
jgi:hypothetical protein